MMQTSSRYETDALLSQYLLFHYGNDHDLMPYSFGPQNSIHFPVRCVTECLDIKNLPQNARALDLGCAVGRSSFELSRYCQQVVGIDNSKTFIAAAKQIQQEGRLGYTIAEEGGQQGMRLAEIPSKAFPNRVEFRCFDVMDLPQELNSFDIVLAANLICRLSNPQAFLKQLSALVVSKGQLILTSPYSWLEEFTPRASWLGSLADIQKILNTDFILERTCELPFLIREHRRKYQWGVSQASIWKRQVV
jgi:putative 4-mercaptohistidine N1-methyltranferase